jgi:UDP-2,3-diacylglucosamine hydrolase
MISGEEDVRFLGEDKEWLVQYAKKKLKNQHFDYFVFGHRHLPLDIALSEHSRYINLGDWIGYFSYGVFDGQDLQIEYFEKEV